MTISEALTELQKIQNNIDKLVIREQELIAEMLLYSTKFENEEIGQVLYDMRMKAIFFENGLNEAQYNIEVKCFNEVHGAYMILQCFENCKQSKKM